MSINIKKQLFGACEKEVEARIANIQNVIASIEEARNNETKSSAGDKYETGRAMMQIEEANNRQQLARALQLRQDLKRLNPERKEERAELGSLVKTNQGYYYLSIGIGKITLEDTVYYCVSISSPIGAKLRHKVVGEVLEFNGNRIRVEEIS